MKPFGALLKQYIQEQGLTIYQVAKSTGIDRSFLQGVLSGSRKLPQKRFTDVVHSTYFTTSQISNLCGAYYLEKLGKEAMERLYRIEAGFKGDIRKELCTVYRCNKTSIPTEQTNFLAAKDDILQAVYSILDREKINCFYSNFSFEHTEINRIVYAACQRRAMRNFFHYTNKNEGKDCHNLNILFNALHYAEEGYYTHITPQPHMFSSMMPYFIFTDSHFIQYDATCENAVIMDAKTVEHYLLHSMDKMKKAADAYPFMTTDPLQAQELIQMLVGSAVHSQTVSFDNAVGVLFLTPQVIAAAATEQIENVPAIIQRIQSHFSLCFGSNRSNFKTLYLTYESVINYVRTGRIPSFPPTHATNIPLALRSQLLHNLLEFAKQKKLQLTNPQMLPIQCHITAQIADNTLLVTLCDDQSFPTAYQEKIVYFTDDKQTVEDFLNYYNYISVSEKTFSPDTSKAILEGFLKELEAM